jgi:hypothetical protein
MEAKDVKKIVEAIDAVKDEVGGLVYSELSGINTKLDRIIELLESIAGQK